MIRFKTFDVSLKDITDLVERWDRTIGAPRPPANIGHDGEDAHHTHPQSGRRGKKDKGGDKTDRGDKHSKHDSQDKESSKTVDKEKEVRQLYIY